MQSYRRSEPVKLRRKLCGYIENLKCISHTGCRKRQRKDISFLDDNRNKTSNIISTKINMFVVLCGSEERVSSGRISRQLQSISPKKSMWCIFKFVGSIQFQNSLYVSVFASRRDFTSPNLHSGGRQIIRSPKISTI